MTGPDTDTLLVIGGRLQALQKAKALGLRVVLLQHKERLAPGQAEAADALLLVDYLDWSVAGPIVRAAHEVYRFGWAMSLVEQGLEPIGRINDMLGLPGTTYEVAHRFRDKLAMRARLAEAGLGHVAAEEVGSAADLRAFGDRHGYPLIVKPIDGTGSRGVAKVDGPDGVERAWEQVGGLRGRTDLALATFYPIDRFMAEQYVDGPEFSVETYSRSGRHSVVAITDKLTAREVEIGHAQPAVLTPEQDAAIVDYVRAVLDVLGLRDGNAHTELRLSADGPRIVESHDRVSGDRVMDLVEAAYGVDLEQYAVGAPFDRVPPLPDRLEPRQASATHFLTAEPGTVVEITGVEDVRAYPGVLDLDVSVAVGDEVHVVADSFDRIGQVLVTAPDTAAAVQLAAELAAKVRVVTRPS